MKTQLTLLMLLMVILTTSCKHPIPEGPLVNDPGSPPIVVTVCDPNVVYFQQQILPILISNCAFSGCHDAASHEDGVVLDSYANIMNTGEIEPGNPYDSELFEKIIESDPDDIMPPPPNVPLTSAQIALIQNWIAQGAQNNSCVGCDTTNVTYTSQIGTLIANRCQGCHSGANPDGGIALTNYNQVKNEALFGLLYDAVTHNGNATNMPYNSAQMPECEIDLIRIWIENGAPN
jgi:mono/diheme cytochrome c family protein